MKGRILTPLGEIYVYVDGREYEYVWEPHVCTVRSVREKPPAGCFRITVPVQQWERICCVAALTEETLPNTPSGGQRYVCAEFVKGRTVLTIGGGDEIPGMETRVLRCGVEYLRRGPVDRVMFGVAWAEDYEGIYDIRTQLAADLY